MNPALTPISVRQLFKYVPETGDLLWLKMPASHRRKSGEAAGSVHRSGYKVILLSRRFYLAHRVAWLWMTGEWPKGALDHRNGVRTDNRWANLREASPQLNCENIRRPQKRTTTGFLGVTRKCGRFAAQIVVKRKNLWLGLFNTPEEAHQAYLVAKRKLHEGCTI